MFGYVIPIVALLFITSSTHAATTNATTSTTVSTSTTASTIKPILPKGQDPSVHYECQKDNGKYTITIYINKNETQNYYAITQIKDEFSIKTDGKNCKKNFTDISGAKSDTVKVILNKCSEDNVYLYLMKKPTFLDTTSKAANVPIVAGGHSFREYIINCKMQDSGTFYNVNYNITDLKNLKESGKIKENPDLKLTLSISTTGTIYIGDKVTLTVTESSTAESYLSFTNCSATDPDNTGTNPFILIKNGSVIETDIVSPLNASTKQGTYSLDFYAFRFATSSKVMISCTIKACLTKDCQAPTPAPTTPKPTSASNRRRRSANNELKSNNDAVSVTFEVHDRKEASGGMKVEHISHVILGAFVFMLTRLL